jgi:XrtJ-associated TM-motif-TM protein
MHCVSREGTVKVKKIFATVPVAILFLTTAAFVHAQGGCVDSPENPTAVFGVIAAAASFGLMHFRKRTGPRDK